VAKKSSKKGGAVSFPKVRPSKQGAVGPAMPAPWDKQGPYQVPKKRKRG